MDRTTLPFHQSILQKQTYTVKAEKTAQTAMSH